MELQMVLPTPDSDEKNGLNLLRRLWVVKFDVEDEIQKLAERWEFFLAEWIVRGSFDCSPCEAL